MESVEIQITSDGFPTLFSGIFSESYHSKYGALTEALHVYIRHGLEAKSLQKSGKLRVGELGLGSCLNAALAYEFSTRNRITIEYHALEAFPPSVEILSRLSDQIPSGLQTFHQQILDLPQGKSHPLSRDFQFSWAEHFWPAPRLFNKLDVFFYDAFSPDKQPELWSVEAFREAFEALETGGILVTYCAKGYVRRHMKEAGFRVERLPGAPGKWEMLRATKI